MEYQVKTKSGLPMKNEQVSKSKPNVGKTILTGIAAVLISVVFGISGQFIYDFYRYDPFIVDGESMYPVLNYDTKVSYSDGTTYDDPANVWKLGDFKSNASYICDYCLMDSSKGFVEKIKRFDIVITYYNSDYVVDGVLKDNASLKVKRVIGLPGETVKFEPDGSLYIKGIDENDYTLVEQDFLSYERNHETRPLVSQEWYERAMIETTNGKVITQTLKNGEYYLVGDNRRLGASLDSRSSVVGPIKESYLVGKAMTTLSKCSYVPGSQPKVLIDRYILPWRLKDL